MVSWLVFYVRHHAHFTFKFYYFMFYFFNCIMLMLLAIYSPIIYPNVYRSAVIPPTYCNNMVNNNAKIFLFSLTCIDIECSNCS